MENSVKHVILHSTAESGFEKRQGTGSSLRQRISLKQNWGKQRTCYHAFKDWNALDSDLKNSGTVCQSRNNLLNLLIYSLLLYSFNICNFYLLLTI